MIFFLLNLVAYTWIFIFLPKRRVSHEKEKQVLQVADKLIANYIISKKLNVSRSDIEFICNSDLDTSEKKAALKMLSEKMEGDREVIYRRMIESRKD